MDTIKDCIINQGESCNYIKFGLQNGAHVDTTLGYGIGSIIIYNLTLSDLDLIEQAIIAYRKNK